MTDYVSQGDPTKTPTTARPKVKEVKIAATDATGALTELTLTGDQIMLDLDSVMSNKDELLPDGGYHAVLTLATGAIGGQFVARGIEKAELTYTEPVRLAKRWEVGQIVRLPKSLTTPDTPYRNKGWLGEVTEVTWHAKCWQYHFEDRYRKLGFYVNESKQLDHVTVLDAWPLRRGDFVTYEGADGQVFKLTERLNDGDLSRHRATSFREVALRTEGKPAWHIEAEDGTWGWLWDESCILVEGIKVVKTQKWESA